MIERKTALRAAANTLPVVRAVAGPVIAHKLKNTPPEERTWRFAGMVGLLAASDKLDGILAREAGTTRLGSWLDQMSDKFFVTPSLKALSDGGEISAAHFYIKATRDVAVSGMRTYAERRHLDTSAHELGRYKTTAEMTSLVLAASPLAPRQGLLEVGMATATGLSITSAIEYGIGYMRNLNQQGET